MAKLVVKGPNGRDEVLTLKEGVHRFGRSSTNEFVVFDSTVSRFHCEIEVRPDGMWVRDLDSANGTFVDDVPVGSEPVQLRKGQVLRLGDVRMEVRDAPEAPPADQVPMCAIHPTFPASMECTQCHRVFCGSCVHLIRRVGGQYLRLCPVCSGPCVPLTVVPGGAKGLLRGMMDRLLKKRTLRHPFQGE
jgi:hypothetical protein